VALRWRGHLHLRLGLLVGESRVGSGRSQSAEAELAGRRPLGGFPLWRLARRPAQPRPADLRDNQPVRRVPTVLMTVLAVGAVAAACGSTPGTGVRANAGSAGQHQSHDSVVTVTTEAPTSPVPSSVATSPASPCVGGRAFDSVAVGPQPSPACLVSGATLTISFDKSHAAIGVPGPWGRPLVQAEPAGIVHIRSARKRGHLLIVRLTARKPGTATVIAGFGQECAAGDTTPCTIPPQAILSVPVTVVARQQP
jgi:hypothetical protein